MTEHRTLVRLPAELRGRRRSAPTVERTSDVTRTRGWLVGSVAGGLGLLAVLVVELSTGSGTDAIGPKRPVSRPHAQAGLTCASCHGDARPGPATAEHDPAKACATCHEGKGTTRPPHAKQRERGAMTCTTCHRIHTAMGGVTFVPGGPAIRWRNGGERELAELEPIGTQGWSGAEATVPLVELAACATCHDPTRANDPMAHCALAGRTGPTDVAVCFDEHRPLLVAAGTERAALWELAREAAALAPPSVEAAAPARPWGAPLAWLLSSLGLAGLGYGLTRAWARRRDAALLARLETEPAKSDAPAEHLRPAERRRLPTIDATTCIGCSACVDACPYDVLELRAYVAVVAKPDDCCGLTLCEQRCPNGSLVISEGERIADLPRLDDDLAAPDAPGVYLAGDITGLPLIRNAINQGAHAIEAIARSLKAQPAKTDLDLIIVGAGPAGISAALAAKQQGLRYLVLEQGSAAESIRSFPRGKLVFDQPLGMPMVGELWLAESSKEELLGKWMRIIHSEQLAIRERVRVTGCEREPGRESGKIDVLGVDPDGAPLRLSCARVLLAFGRRGSPRKLDVEIPDAMLDHVHYNLADAHSFAGRRVCVVGLGDVAMEAAIGLANQAGTRVTVCYRGEGFKRGKKRNIDGLQRLVAAGRVELMFSTTVAGVEPGRVRLQTPSGEVLRDVDSVFVMIGTVAPTRLLEAFGVRQVGDD